ncbi:predicted protein [Histoplasma capsulatum G186AR]|uniref:Uncharacterized protein n=1 Tax=Ajellomyces capsulatus (strain G186AR / H82 / ATCC MYA-2454 / RMSCC 2432) TaxID=447093 RepID=C0NNV8_AJECG|nr:uncharacterized protein HCBG_04838 [Histoplasma capsulatum G186AR]EEH06618.1 predicted protein [Histoplasma capsulatum G186AR]
MQKSMSLANQQVAIEPQEQSAVDQVWASTVTKALQLSRCLIGRSLRPKLGWNSQRCPVIMDANATSFTVPGLEDGPGNHQQHRPSEAPSRLGAQVENGQTK